MTITRSGQRAPSGSIRRSTRDVLVGLVSAAVLLAAGVGIPVALVVIGPDLVDLADVVSRVPDSLWQPDDGSLFLLALLAVAWLTWAAFTVSVAIEVVHVARGLPAPRLPALGPVQRMAAALVTSAAVLVTPAQALPGQAGSPPPPPPPAVAAAPATAGGTASVSVAHRDAETTPEPVPTGPEIVVVRHDTLWGLAEQHLGSGQRYREILTLNLGRPQPDGRALTEAGVLYPGWRLVLPEGATPPARDVLDRDVDHVVESGDTLWEIAEDRLGSGERYPEVFDLNAEVVQPDGGRLRDPDLIQVGWQLDLPEGDGNQPKTPVVSEPPAESQVASEEQQKPVPPAPTPLASPQVRAPEALDSGSAQVELGVEQASADDEASVDPGLSAPLPPLVLGMSAVALAAFVGEVARRRTRQRRERLVGERLPMPEPELQAVERLAAVGASEGPSRTALTETLRELADACRRAGRLLPDVVLVLLGREHVDLVLRDADEDAVEPFAADEAGRVWRSVLSQPRRHAESIDPYPALVSLGTTTDGSTVLVNLDALGCLDISGDPETAGRALSALGLELALAAADSALTVTVAGEGASLVEAFVGDPVRRSADGVSSEVRSRIVSAAVALQQSCCADIRQARSEGACSDVQTEVVVSATRIDAHPTPWCGVAVVELAPEAPESEWRLHCQADGRGRLHPAGLNLEVQQLSPPDQARLLAVLGLAEQGCRLPASEDEHQPTVDEAADHGGAVIEKAVSALRASTRFSGRGQSTVSTDEGWLRVDVLGKIEILHAESDLNTSRRERARELLTYLVLNPGASAYELDEALWPGRRVEPSSRNPFISRVRQWLGYAPDGGLYLPFVRDGGHYHLHDRVICDWHEFVTLSHRGFAAGVDGIPDLEAALSLVRGRPFLGIDPGRYTWAEPQIQEMIAAVCDVAHLVSQARAERGEWRAAQHAAATGLLVDPVNDLLYLDAVAAAGGAQDETEVGRLRSLREVVLTALDA